MSSTDLNSVQFNSKTDSDIQRAQAAFMSRVYAWMSLALCITGGIAYYLANTPELIQMLFASSMNVWIVIIAQVGLVFYLTRSMQKIRSQTATALFLVYAALNGLLFA